jgi:hypothetical protein
MDEVEAMPSTYNIDGPVSSNQGGNRRSPFSILLFLLGVSLMSAVIGATAAMVYDKHAYQNSPVQHADIPRSAKLPSPTPPPPPLPALITPPQPAPVTETQEGESAVKGPPIVVASHVLWPEEKMSARIIPDTVASVAELQPYRKDESLTNNAGDSVTLTNLNPYVGAWYILETRFGDKCNKLHLETPLLNGHTMMRPRIILYRDGLVIQTAPDKKKEFPLWPGQGVSPSDATLPSDPSLTDWIVPGYEFPSAYTPVCDGLLLVRTHKEGSASRIEQATDILRKSRLGDWLVEKAKPYLIPSPETGGDAKEGGPAEESKASAGETSYPKAAQVNEKKRDLVLVPKHLAIESDAPEGVFHYGKWYSAVNHQGIYTSIIKTGLLSPSVLESYTDRVNAIGRNDNENKEADALTYLVAFDLSLFRFGFALGTEHPSVGWSARAVEVKKDGKGPDGFDSTAPLSSIGSVPPYLTPYVEATFIGGFKREHGAFRVGKYAKENNATHFGFAQDGVVFSRPYPELATILIDRGGEINLLPWPQDSSTLLSNMLGLRQNCVPIVSGIDKDGLPIPGKHVNEWGRGAWSGNYKGDFLTVRAGLGLQEHEGRRYLIYAYFSGATPSSMARVFQAYGCNQGMLLDMNYPSLCYMALVNRGQDGAIAGAEYLHYDMGSNDRVSKKIRFLQTNDIRDFFYVTRLHETSPKQ